MGTVFISYRREITAGEARALFNELLGKLGKNSVFMDVDSIALGRDFRGALQKTLESCDLMLVLIGRDWAEVKDEEGRPRLHCRGTRGRHCAGGATSPGSAVLQSATQGDAAAGTGRCRAHCRCDRRSHRRTFHPQAVIKTAAADYFFRRCDRRCERGPEP